MPSEGPYIFYFSKIWLPLLQPWGNFRSKFFQCGKRNICAFLLLSRFSFLRLRWLSTRIQSSVLVLLLGDRVPPGPPVYGLLVPVLLGDPLLGECGLNLHGKDLQWSLSVG